MNSCRRICYRKSAPTQRTAKLVGKWFLNEIKKELEKEVGGRLSESIRKAMDDYPEERGDIRVRVSVMLGDREIHRDEYDITGAKTDTL